MKLQMRAVRCGREAAAGVPAPAVGCAGGGLSTNLLSSAGLRLDCRHWTRDGSLNKGPTANRQMRALNIFTIDGEKYTDSMSKCSV